MKRKRRLEVGRSLCNRSMEGRERIGIHGRRSWSDLPPEILSEFGKRLRTKLEVVRFRSVCSSWRSSLWNPFSDQIQQFPIAIPAPPDASPKCKIMGPGSFMVIETTLYRIQPKDPNPNCGGKCGKTGIGVGFFGPCSTTARLAAVDEVLPGRFIAGRVFLPFGFRTFAKVMNILDDVSIFSISKFYRIMYVHNKEEEQVKKGGAFFDRFKLIIGCFEAVDKAVVVSEYDYMNFDDNVALASLSVKGQLGLLRLLRTDTGTGRIPDPMGWRVVDKYGHDHKSGLRFDDIANVKGQLYAIDCKGSAFLVDCDSLKVTQVVPPPAAAAACHLQQDIEFLTKRKRLLEASGVLYLLVPCQGQVKIYELKFQIRSWVQVNSLGDEAFFVGNDFSFSAPARDILSKVGCEGNCIFLNRTSFPTYDRHSDNGFTPLFEELLPGEVGVFDLSQGAKLRLATGYNCPEMLTCPPCCLSVE